MKSMKGMKAMRAMKAMGAMKGRRVMKAVKAMKVSGKSGWSAWLCKRKGTKKDQGTQTQILMKVMEKWEEENETCIDMSMVLKDKGKGWKGGKVPEGFEDY